MLKVNVPIADLRKEPKHLTPLDFSNNPLRDSQLIYGEELLLIESQNEWLYVEAKEQPKFTKERGWHGYLGWVHISEVIQTVPQKPQFISVEKDHKFGTFTHEKTRYTRPFNAPFSREQFLNDAKLFLDFPYLWGGKSFFSEKPLGSVDCSGLIYLLYRAQGIIIPRDAHDQYLKSKIIPRQALKPGDLIFWANPEAPERIKHVIIYLDNHHFLEAPYTGKKVRILPLHEDFFIEKTLQSFPDREKSYHIFCADGDSLIF